MNKNTGRLIAVAVSIALAACGHLPREERVTQTGVDGVACVGAIQNTPSGMAETDDPALLSQARAATGKGGICAGKVFTVREKVRVYRVWDASRQYTQMGRWWSLRKPEGPKDKYRHEYAICPSWSALDHLVSCEVTLGASIVIGTTQSAACEDGDYPKTSLNQVYIPNNAAQNLVLVNDCRDEGAWPE